MSTLSALGQGGNAPTIVLSLPDSALSSGCARADHACLSEDAGTVDVALSVANPPSEGAYRNCRVEVALGENTASADSDYRLPGNEGRVRLSAQSNWRATSTLTVLADDVEEGTETVTLQGKCGGTVGDTTPRHGDLLASPLTIQITDAGTGPPPPPPDPPPPEPPPDPPPSATTTIVLSVATSYLTPEHCASTEHGCLLENIGSVQVTMGLRNPPPQGSYRDCRLEAATGPNTATAGDDYRVVGLDTKRLRADEGWQASFTLEVVADDVDEGTETFTIAGKCGGTGGDTTPRHTALESSAITLQIADANGAQPPDPPPPPPPPPDEATAIVLSVAAGYLTPEHCAGAVHGCLLENIGTVQVTMGLRNPPAQGSYRDCRLEAATGPNTATLRQDYRLGTDSKRLEADQSWRASFTLTVLPDDVDEGTETFTIAGRCGGTGGDTTPSHTALELSPLTLQIADANGVDPPPEPPPPEPPPPPPSGTPALVVSLPSSALAPDQCASGDHPCVPEGAGEVEVTLTLRDPPAAGSYRTCLLEVAQAGPNTAASGVDYRLPARDGDRARLSAQTDWRATLPLAFLADADDAEGTELFTVQGACGGSSEGATPRHTDLAAIPLTIQIADGVAEPPPPPAVTPTIVLSLPTSVLAADRCANRDHPCIAEDVGEVAVTLRIVDPPAEGGYRTCLLEVARPGPNTAGAGKDYALPERSGDRARLSAQTGWQATLPLTIVADDDEEETEAFTVAGKCGGTAGDTSPRHTELAAEAMTVQIADVAPLAAPRWSRGWRLGVAFGATSLMGDQGTSDDP